MIYDHLVIDQYFIPENKVFLDGEFEGIIDFKFHELSAIICWDTPKENDFEDWSGLWGSFHK
jgi:hypothetical protein